MPRRTKSTPSSEVAPETSLLDRRSFCVSCVAAITGMACGGGGGGGSTSTPKPTSQEINSNKTRANLVMNQPLLSSGNPTTGCSTAGAGFFLVKDAGGVYAMRASCSHEAHQLEPGTSAIVGTAIKCSCTQAQHGSEYDINGVVTRGPGGGTTSPLDHYRVREEAGTGFLIVDVLQFVPAATRI
jgi:nitrite reductase/ring-hydroxylating ferredoxin subunit